MFGRYQHDVWLRNFGVTVSVVDRLPRPIDQYSQNGGTYTRQDVREVPRGSREGLAYTIVDHVAATPLQDTVSTGRHGGVGKGDDTRTFCLRFRSHSSSVGAGRADAVSQIDEQEGDMTLQLPLANTLFETGHPQTMLRSEWSSTDGALNLLSMKHLVLAEALLDLSSMWDASHQIRQTDVLADLVPLTPTQKVHTAMGNVIRELSDPADAQNVIPASQQLENSVASYFRALNVPQQAVSVWALVVPDSLPHQSPFDAASIQEEPGPKVGAASDDLVELWKAPGIMWQDHVLGALARGGRLVKVLSGGGGWGKRAGLLSLDSETSFVAPDDEIPDTMPFDAPAFLTAPGAAKPGESVQFFISTQERSTSEPVSLRRRLVTLDFGTVASEALASESEVAVEGPAHLDIYENYFGALTEKGIALKVAQDDHAAWTKVNVPDSRVITTLVPKSPLHDKPHAGSSGLKARVNITDEPEPPPPPPDPRAKGPHDPRARFKQFLWRVQGHLRAWRAYDVAKMLEALLTRDIDTLPSHWRWIYGTRSPRRGTRSFALSLATKWKRLEAQAGRQGDVSLALDPGAVMRDSGLATNVQLGNTGHLKAGGDALLDRPLSVGKGGRKSGRLVIRRTLWPPSKGRWGAAPRVLWRRTQAPPGPLLKKFPAHAYESLVRVRFIKVTPSRRAHEYTDPQLANMADVVMQLLRDE